MNRTVNETTPAPFYIPPMPSMGYPIEPKKGVSWGLIGTILGAIVAAGTIAGALGNNFFVARTEYNASQLHLAEQKVYISQSLDRIEKNLTSQNSSIEKLEQIVSELRYETSRRKKNTYGSTSPK
jgi:hypothetical protein